MSEMSAVPAGEELKKAPFIIPEDLGSRISLQDLNKEPERDVSKGADQQKPETRFESFLEPSVVIMGT